MYLHVSSSVRADVEVAVELCFMDRPEPLLYVIGQPPRSKRIPQTQTARIMVLWLAGWAWSVSVHKRTGLDYEPFHYNRIFSPLPGKQSAASLSRL